MNLREIAGNQPPNRALQLKIQQQARQIAQLQEENRWLKEQLAKISTTESKTKPGIFSRSK